MQPASPKDNAPPKIMIAESARIRMADSLSATGARIPPRLYRPAQKMQEEVENGNDGNQEKHGEVHVNSSCSRVHRFNYYGFFASAGLGKNGFGFISIFLIDCK